MYITPAQLAESPRAQEIAQVATPENAPIVETVLMDAVLRGLDTSAFAPDQVALANQALATVAAAIADVNQLIDGYLAKRYTLPFAAFPTLLTTWARALVRYRLHKDQIGDAATHPIARDYRDAIKFLSLVADGTISLGAGDPTASGGTGLAQVVAPGRVFTAASLADFGGRA